MNRNGMNFSNIKYIAICIGALICLMLLIVFGLNGVKNNAITLEETVKVAKSDINVQEKRRLELIGDLVDCVKEYDEYEYNTMIAIIEARATNNSNLKDSENAIAEVNTMLNATAEAYPELKSSENYKTLMNELSTTENLIANYRTNYNNQVKEYREYVRKFPNNTILNMLGYEMITYEYLEFEINVDPNKGLFD